MKPHILCVDDDPNVLAGYERNLRKNYTIHAVISPQQALDTLEHSGPFAVVVADMNMPAMNGIEFLKKVRQRYPDTVRFMLTGNADQLTAVRAVNDGHVYRFLTKPCPPEMLALALDSGVKQYRLTLAERELLENTLNGAIRVLTDILASIDPDSFGRGQTLRDHMTEFLTSMNVQKNWEYDVAALLSQIGNVAIPPSILHKKSHNEHLTPQENDIALRLPQIGSELLSRIPRLEGVAEIILYQNKCFDGSGLPLNNVSREQIPLGARILKVLGDLHQLESSGLSRADALLKLQHHQGTYDPRVLDAAFKCFDVYLPVPSSEATTPLQLPLTSLQPGMLLLSNVQTLDNLLILTAGNKLTPVMLEKIRNFARLSGIQEPISVAPPSPKPQ